MGGRLTLITLTIGQHHLHGPILYSLYHKITYINVSQMGHICSTSFNDVQLNSSYFRLKCLDEDSLWLSCTGGLSRKWRRRPLSGVGLGAKEIQRSLDIYIYISHYYKVFLPAPSNSRIVSLDLYDNMSFLPAPNPPGHHLPLFSLQ